MIYLGLDDFFVAIYFWVRTSYGSGFTMGALGISTGVLERGVNEVNCY